MQIFFEVLDLIGGMHLKKKAYVLLKMKVTVSNTQLPKLVAWWFSQLLERATPVSYPIS